MHRVTRTIRHFAEGFGMGVANVIPGVSGGTMALIFGIYERLVGAMSDGVKAAGNLRSLDFRGFLDRIVSLPWVFLVPLVAGIVSAPLLGAGLIERLLEQYPEVMRGLFLGMIIGSLPVPWVRTRQRGAVGISLLVVAAVVAFVLAGLPARASVNPSDLRIFWTAALAVTAMILPGISGSYLLLVLGMYIPMLEALDQFDLGYLFVFAAGAASGLAAFSVLLNWLLRNRHDVTMLVLVGLMFGSLRALWPWQTESIPRWPAGSDPLGPVIIALVAGAVVTGALTWIEVRRIRAERSE